MTGLTSKLDFDALAEKARINDSQQLVAKNGLDGLDGLGAERSTFGTTKEDYVAALSRAGASGMQFQLVFVEACKSELQAELMVQLRTNVGFVHTAGKQRLDYQTLDYDDVVSDFRNGTSIGDAIHSALVEVVE
jgi:hypothetical protein